MRRLALLLTATALAFAPASRAADAPEDPAELVRRAQTAASVDRDLERAAALYRRALEIAGGSDAARDALLGLLRFEGAAAPGVDGLAVATRLWTEFGARLTEEDRNRVTEVLRRLLPPGTVVKGPLGVFVVRRAETAGDLSPVEETILEQLRTLKGLEGERRAARENEIEATLRSVGRDAMPALEYAIRTEGPDVAPFAARLFAQSGGPEAIPALAKILAGPDPFARAAARDALDQVGWTEEQRSAYVEAMSPLLDLPAVAPVRKDLRGRLAEALSPAGLFARYEAGGPDAAWWLGQAVLALHDPALQVAIALGQGGRALDEEVVKSLGQVYGYGSSSAASDSFVVNPTNPSVPAGDRQRVLLLLASQPTSAPLESALRSVAATLTLGPVTASWDRAADVAYRHVLGLPSLEERRQAFYGLLNVGIPFPPAVLADLEAPLGEALAWGMPYNFAWSTRALLGETQRAEPALWRAVAAALTHAVNASARASLAQAVEASLRMGGSKPRPLPPPEHDEAWGALLPQLFEAPGSGPSRTPWAYEAAARGAKPAFLAWARRYLGTVPTTAHGERGPVLGLLSTLEGPEGEAFALDSLIDPALFASGLVERQATRREFWDAFLVRAAAWTGEELTMALNHLRHGVLQAVENHALGNVSGRTPFARPSNEPGSRFFAAGARGGWIPLLRRDDIPWDRVPVAGVARLAAASGDPDYLTLLTTLPRASAADAARWNALAGALPWFGAAIPVAWLEQRLADPDFTMLNYVDRRTPTAMATLLWGDDSPEAASARIRLARRPTAPQGGNWLRALRDGDPAATAREVLAAYARDGGTTWPLTYREELIFLSQRLKLKESIPFLLTEYQGPLEAAAKTALDTIRAYHERLTSFESWAKDLTEGRRDLSRLLEDPDPAIRRAAVLSLGALGDRDALPALVRIAKAEQDPAVRAAALEAVERIARSPAPPQAPAKPAPEEPSDAPK